MTARSDEALNRLVTHYAELNLSAASIDDLLKFLDDARKALRSVKGENPMDAAMAGFTAGFCLREALQDVPASRRPDVSRHLTVWLPDVVALEDRDYQLTVQSWATRAARARVDAKDSFKRVRA